MKTCILNLDFDFYTSLSPSALVRYQIWAGEQDKATLTLLDSHKATPGLEIAKTFVEKYNCHKH